MNEWINERVETLVIYICNNVGDTSDVYDGLVKKVHEVLNVFVKNCKDR